MARRKRRSKRSSFGAFGVLPLALGVPALVGMGMAAVAAFMAFKKPSGSSAAVDALLQAQRAAAAGQNYVPGNGPQPTSTDVMPSAPADKAKLAAMAGAVGLVTAVPAASYLQTQNQGTTHASTIAMLTRTPEQIAAELAAASAARASAYARLGQPSLYTPPPPPKVLTANEQLISNAYANLMNGPNPTMGMQLPSAGFFQIK